MPMNTYWSLAVSRHFGGGGLSCIAPVATSGWSVYALPSIGEMPIRGVSLYSLRCNRQCSCEPNAGGTVVNLGPCAYGQGGKDKAGGLRKRMPLSMRARTVFFLGPGPVRPIIGGERRVNMVSGSSYAW